MNKSSGRNVGKYYTGGTEGINQHSGRDEVIGQTSQDNSFTVDGSLIGEKKMTEGALQAHKGSVAVQTKNRTIGLDHTYDIKYDYTSRFPIGF